ncbi:CoA transferase [Azospirillum sp.]|uniref:CaiB/BaiF CoA transferase family protein n=1 Tax=Azospirillum sp. TaxID=34012 RepID=UPI002D271E4A|nr:CoA transferase [Azospirillum sp.]HYD68752.1 CoA transferase [Azospirillum sp.]
MTLPLPSGALAGIRVVDLSRVLGGPYCTQTLADHGAEVIKVEPPQGDETRQWGPPFKDGLSAYFSGANRNKRSLALDLSRPEGHAVLFRLLDGADVLVHNFKPGTLERWGLGYDAVLKERFPRLVYCHITGFGEDGPLGGLPGYDAVVQAMTGTMSINGTPVTDGDPGTGPLRMGTPIIDIGTGLIAVIGILSALVERNRSGLGQKLDVPLYDCAISMLHPHAANHLMSGAVPKAAGNSHPNIAPYDMFATRTKPIYLAIGNNGQFVKLCALLGVPDVAKDPRFATNADRIANRPALSAVLAERLRDADADALESQLLAAGVPAGAVRTVKDALEHPHTAHRDMVVGVDGYRGTGIPVKMSRTPGTVHTAPPAFGADSRAVLRAAGYDDAAIDALVEQGVVLVG